MTLVFARSSGFISSAKKLGRGNSSGKGTYCGKGIKGQKARAGKGSHVPAHFEGGQTPLHRRLPKLRGFKKFYKHLSDVQAVSLGRIETYAGFADGSTLSKSELYGAGFIKNVSKPVKILSSTSFTKKLSFVDVELFSTAARTVIEQSGSTIA